MPSRRPSRPRPATPPARAPLAARLDAPSERYGVVALVAMMTLSAVATTLLCALKYRHYLYLDIDLPMFTQAVAGIARGTLVSSIRGMNWLGDHSSLVLFPLAAPFALAPHPLTLLALQAVAAALGAWPVWSLARRELGPGFAPLALAGCYLLYPALGYATLYEFHPEVLCGAALLATLACWRAGDLAWAALFAALTLLGKEDAALPIGALALVALADRRALPAPARVRFALTFAVLALASLALSFGVLKPMLNRGEVEYGRMYAAWGATPGEVVRALVAHPLRALAAFVSDPAGAVAGAVKREYHLHLLLPLLFVPLASPLTLAIALPTLATHFLSDRVAQHTIYYQYTAYVTPVVFTAAILGARRVLAWRPGLGAATLGVALLAATLAAGALYGPVFGRGLLQTARSEQRTWPDGTDRAVAAYRDRMLAALPARAAVVAGNEFLGRLATRPAAYAFLNTVSGVYTYSTKPYPMPPRVDALVADVASGPLQRFVDARTGERIRALVRGHGLALVDAAGDNLCFRAGAPDTLRLLRFDAPPAAAERAITFDGALRFAGDDLAAGPVAPGGLLTLRTTWRRMAPTGTSYWMQLAAYDERGHAAFARTRPLGYLVQPVGDWPDTVRVGETYRLIVPADCPAGTYMLGMRVGRNGPDGPVLADTEDEATRQRNMVVELGRFTVAPRR